MVDFGTLVVDNAYVRVGLALLFIPLNLLAYLNVAPEKNNQVSSMVNLFRNLGGAVGIAIVSTATERWAQLHQDTFSMHLTPFAPMYRHQLTGLSTELLNAGVSAPDAIHQAIGRIYAMVQMQATTEAYLDTIKLLAVVCLAILPCVLVLKKNHPADPQGAAL